VAGAVAIEFTGVTCYLAAHGVACATRAEVEWAGRQVRFTWAVAHPWFNFTYRAKASGVNFMHRWPIGRAVANFRPVNTQTTVAWALRNLGLKFRWAQYVVPTFTTRLPKQPTTKLEFHITPITRAARYAPIVTVYIGNTSGTSSFMPWNIIEVWNVEVLIFEVIISKRHHDDVIESGDMMQTKIHNRIVKDVAPVLLYR